MTSLMVENADAKVDNVVLVVIDALRADKVGVYSDSDLTPNIDKLAAEGEVFENCFSCINTTDPSVTTILSGQYPTRHGVLNHGTEVSEEEMNYASGTTMIAELMQDDYFTLCIDVLERWHSKGFDRYLSPKSKQRSKIMDFLASVIRKSPRPIRKSAESIHSLVFNRDQERWSESRVMNEIFEDELSKTDENFFSFLHFWDPHIPYPEPQDNHPETIRQDDYSDDRAIEDLITSISDSAWGKQLQKGLLSNVDSVADVKRNYDFGVKRADDAIGRLVEFLKSRNIYEETAIVITADHGESITEHGILFDHHGLYDPTIHVPLVIKAPGFSGTEKEYVQHFDLAPTTLDLAGTEYKNNRFDGRSLVSLDETRCINRDAVFAEEAHTCRRRAIRTDSYKYIKSLSNDLSCRYCGVTHAADKELYYLDDDPNEKHNIASQNQDIVANLDSQLSDWISKRPSPSSEASTYKLSHDVEERLESMGYV